MTAAATELPLVSSITIADESPARLALRRLLQHARQILQRAAAQQQRRAAGTGRLRLPCQRFRQNALGYSLLRKPVCGQLQGKRIVELLALCKQLL